MVGVERFEGCGLLLEGVEIQKETTAPDMPNAQKNEIDTLRQQLADADKKRRELLRVMFLNYTGDNSVILETLFSEATPETLNCIEAMLAKGGA